MATGFKTGGRQKGVPNKVTRAVKDVIAFAAEELGGGERLRDWAKEDPSNEKAFWTVIYPKLLPMMLSGDSENPIITEIRHTIVDPKQ